MMLCTVFKYADVKLGGGYVLLVTSVAILSFLRAAVGQESGQLTKQLQDDTINEIQHDIAPNQYLTHKHWNDSSGSPKGGKPMISLKTSEKIKDKNESLSEKVRTTRQNSWGDPFSFPPFSRYYDGSYYPHWSPYHPHHVHPYYPPVTPRPTDPRYPWWMPSRPPFAPPPYTSWTSVMQGRPSPTRRPVSRPTRRPSPQNNRPQSSSGQQQSQNIYQRPTSPPQQNTFPLQSLNPNQQGGGQWASPPGGQTLPQTSSSSWGSPPSPNNNNNVGYTDNRLGYKLQNLSPPDQNSGGYNSQTVQAYYDVNSRPPPYNYDVTSNQIREPSRRPPNNYDVTSNQGREPSRRPPYNYDVTSDQGREPSRPPPYNYDVMGNQQTSPPYSYAYFIRH